MKTQVKFLILGEMEFKEYVDSIKSKKGKRPQHVSLNQWNREALVEALNRYAERGSVFICKTTEGYIFRQEEAISD